jgi:hypothetical protein
LRLSAAIERSIVRLRLESQGEFVALINAIQMQLESAQPIEKVVRLLADALLALAEARGIDAERLRMAQHLDTLVNRVRTRSGGAKQ